MRTALPGVRPVYVVVQASDLDDDLLAAARDGVAEVFDHFFLNPAEGETVLVAVTEVADRLYVNRQLSGFEDVSGLQFALSPIPGRDPERAFALVRAMIDEDMHRLRNSGLQPAEPFVLVTPAALDSSPPREPLQQVRQLTEQLTSLSVEVVVLSQDGSFPAAVALLGEPSVRVVATAAEVVQAIKAMIVSLARGEHQAAMRVDPRVLDTGP